VQSGLTCAVAAAIASLSFARSGAFFVHWIQSWLVAWAMMIPVVVLASPFIRRISDAFIVDCTPSSLSYSDILDGNWQGRVTVRARCSARITAPQRSVR
jgi:hypothetical protein